VWYTSARDLPVICRIAEQKLSFEVHSLKQHLNCRAWTTETILGSSKCKVRTYFLVKIQLSVITYHPGLCIYSKGVVDTLLQRIGWHGAWHLWHLSGGLHIPIKHRFWYELSPSGMSRACTWKFSVWKMTLCVCWQPQIQSIHEGENMLGMEQNESFKGNVQRVFTVQRRVWSGIIGEQE